MVLILHCLAHTLTLYHCHHHHHYYYYYHCFCLSSCVSSLKSKSSSQENIFPRENRTGKKIQHRKISTPRSAAGTFL